MIRSFDVDGCRRRRGQPGRGPPRFRCNGQSGPPCTIKRGDTVYLDVEFAPGDSFLLLWRYKYTGVHANLQLRNYKLNKYFGQNMMFYSLDQL